MRNPTFRPALAAGPVAVLQAGTLMAAPAQARLRWYAGAFASNGSRECVGQGDSPSLGRLAVGMRRLSTRQALMRMAKHVLAASCAVAGFGSVMAAGNVAPLGKATQSSDFGHETAARAIDGNTNGIWGSGSVQSTQSDSGNGVGNGFAWWQVALDQDYLVSDITVWNRTDCCVDRLRAFTVSLWDNHVQVWSGSFSEGNGPTPNFTFFAIGKVGDMVRVQLDRQDYLHMAEVEVVQGVVPEPGTYALMLAGLALVGGIARRRG